MPTEAIKLTRDCEVLEIPSGARRMLPSGMSVRISQSLGDSYTIEAGYGQLFRIDSKDADALGISPAQRAEDAQIEFSEKAVWDTLRTIFDPEIPVNIADLGLIYGCEITPIGDNQFRVDIKMTLTAPGCGMADVLKADVERKISALRGANEVKVEVVFDPPWDPSRMSESAKLQLGFDLDYAPPPSLPVIKPGS